MGHKDREEGAGERGREGKVKLDKTSAGNGRHN